MARSRLHRVVFCAASRAALAAALLPATVACKGESAAPASAVRTATSPASQADEPRAPVGDRLPELVDPAPDQPRAPAVEVFGLRVGVSTLADVKARVASLGLTCADRSMRASIERMREKKAELEAADGASVLVRRTRYETSAQIRLTCDQVPGSALGDRPRPEQPGRLLFVFDGEAHPLRHVSFHRRYPGDRLLGALADARSTFSAYEVLLGEPSESRGELPPPVGEGALAADPPALKSVRRAWRFADLHAKAVALQRGKSGVTVIEEVEVPWPVRPDAPALP